MISFNLRPFSSFLMMGVFFSLFRAYLNFIHQTTCTYVRPFDCQPIFNFICFIFKLFLRRYINLIYHLFTNSFALIFTAQHYTHSVRLICCFLGNNDNKLTNIYIILVITRISCRGIYLFYLRFAPSLTIFLSAVSFDVNY